MLACFDRITADPRHDGCQIMISEPIEVRAFAAWDMAYVTFGDLAPAQRQGFIDLQQLHASAKMAELQHDRRATVFVRTFLAGFRDLTPV